MPVLSASPLQAIGIGGCSFGSFDPVPSLSWDDDAALARELLLDGLIVQPDVGPLVAAVNGESCPLGGVSGCSTEAMSEPEWLRAHKAIGAVLGVTCEGFDPSDLLRDIEAWHQTRRVSASSSQPSGSIDSKCVWELN